MKAKDGTILRITEEVAYRAYELGIRLGLSPPRMRIISRERGDILEATAEVFEQWLEGRGKKPVTWMTLLQVLKECEFVNLAESVEKVLI